MGEGTAKKGLAAAGGAMNDEILSRSNPIATAEAGDLAAIEAAARAKVKVLEAGALFEGGDLQQPTEPTILAMDDLALDQQAEALFEGETVGGTLGELLGQRGGHAVELQAVQ
jgi:hypothetical protein